MAYTTIDDPSAYFQAKTYAGNSIDNTAITNDGNSDLQSDLIWFKRIDTPADHFYFDSNRGVTKTLKTSSSDAEITTTTILKSFDTNGFTVGINSNSNSSSGTYVAWQWKCNGGTTSTNTDGDINSTVQVNQDAGFTIVQYSPSDSTQRTIGHGMGSTPDIVWIRARNRVEDTWFYHGAIGLSGAQLNSGTTYNTSPASTALKGVGASTFTVGTNPVVNGAYNYIAYCWKEIQGYSKFGKYVGNGNNDGPFVYTGFKPAFIIVKVTDDARDWRMFDAKRSTFNVIDDYLTPNTNAIQGTSSLLSYDFLSNGFKLRGNHVSTNQSGKTFIYMAFAENPFVTSTGIPTTAR